MSPYTGASPMRARSTGRKLPAPSWWQAPAFNTKRPSHVALVEGDVDRCIAAAKTIARERGIPQLTVMFPYDNQVLEEKLASLGFETAPSDFISMGMYR